MRVTSRVCFAALMAVSMVKVATAAEATGKICVLRVSDPATLVPIKVSENSTLLAKVKVHEYFCVDRPAGTYEYAAQLWSNKEPGPAAPITVKAGETQYYKSEYVVRREGATPYYILTHIDEVTYQGLLPAVKPVSAANLFFATQ